jgi:hypothetical protein
MMLVFMNTPCHLSLLPLMITSPARKYCLSKVYSILAMASTEPQLDSTNDRFERMRAEDTVVSLNRLCTICLRFTETSKLLQKFSRQVRIGQREQELVGLCSAERLKIGYLDGCHLCALFWQLIDCEYLIRNDPTAPLEVWLTAFTRELGDEEGDPTAQSPFM